MAVDVDPRDEPFGVELGVELGGVQVGLDPEHVHRAGGRARQQHRVGGQDGAGFLVAGERREALRQPAQEGILQPLRRQFDGDAAEPFTVRPVDHGALVQSEGADAVAGAEEREVLGHDPVQQPGEFALHPVLGGALVLGRVAGGEGTAAHNDARIVGTVPARAAGRLPSGCGAAAPAGVRRSEGRRGIRPRRRCLPRARRGAGMASHTKSLLAGHGGARGAPATGSGVPSAVAVLWPLTPRRRPRSWR